jgi:peroxiredoxin
MNFKYYTLLAIALVVLLGGFGCGGSSLAACPPLGTITTIDKPDAPLKSDILVNSPMPNFGWDCVDPATLETNSKADLSQYIGKPLVIVFHKSMNCPGCKEQLPYLQAASKTFKDAGLSVLAVYRSDKPADVKEYSQKNAIDFTSLADPNDRVASKLGFAVGAPMTVFIDKKGIIKKYQIGTLPGQAAVDEIIKSL